mmetsp:Transcript_32892/g.48012  ORF Transcript_32892/g.48012 Transcript_32892/m.48012 type:complete len:327 (-) Transcript_32892:100-1080(-)
MMMTANLFSALLAVLLANKNVSAFQPSSSIITSLDRLNIRQLHQSRKLAIFRLAEHQQQQQGCSHDGIYQPDGLLLASDDGTIEYFLQNEHSIDLAGVEVPSTAIAIATVALMGTPTPALASDTAGPVGSAILAWIHFLGILGVAGGLVTERLVIKKNMSVDEENIINGADLIYGLSAFSLLISGYFRVTGYAKGWDFYKNEPIFWVKMSSVAVLGALSFFPAIVFFRRDMARKEGVTLPPLSDALVERCTTIINAEISGLIFIPLFASLMARGVFYVNDFPWAIGVALYAVCLGGAGFKYVKEALDMMEEEGALVPIEKSSSSFE